MKLVQVKKRESPFRHLLLEPHSFHNLHLIAISNLDSEERRVERWWSKKYGTPIKPYEKHTFEELLVEMLEDYYDNNPEEIKKFTSELVVEDDWDGSMSQEYEDEIQNRLKKVNRGVSLKKYQSKKVLSGKEEQALLDNLGKGLPKSSVTKRNDEFEDKF